MYRQLMDYKGANLNKANPEGSIQQWYLNTETISFCEAYLEEENEVEPTATSSKMISVVNDDVHPWGNLSRKWNLRAKDVQDAHWCVLMHCDEIDNYRNYSLTNVCNGDHDMHKRNFPEILNQVVSFYLS